MKRGTTPTIKLMVTGCDMALFEKVFVTIFQNGTSITKSDEELIVDGGTVILKLSQEETLSLQTGDVQLQLRAVTEEGTAVASEIRKVPVERILQEGVI